MNFGRTLEVLHQQRLNLSEGTIMEIIISEVRGNAIDVYFDLIEESKDPMLNDVNTSS